MKKVVLNIIIKFKSCSNMDDEKHLTCTNIIMHNKSFRCVHIHLIIVYQELDEILFHLIDECSNYLTNNVIWFIPILFSLALWFFLVNSFRLDYNFCSIIKTKQTTQTYTHRFQFLMVWMMYLCNLFRTFIYYQDQRDHESFYHWCKLNEGYVSFA
jgi:hypothetical protein